MPFAIVQLQEAQVVFWRWIDAAGGFRSLLRVDSKVKPKQRIIFRMIHVLLVHLDCVEILQGMFTHNTGSPGHLQILLGEDL